MAAQTLSNMRKAQSLLRDCHDWLVKNNETLLALEFCRIEGELALLFERKCFATSPCSGLPQQQRPLSTPRGPRRKNHSSSGNGGYRPPPANKGGNQGPAGSSGRQNSPPQATKGGPGKACSALNRPAGKQDLPVRATESRAWGLRNALNRRKPIQVTRAPTPVKKAPPPTGVLVDFNEDVELIKLLPSMVAEMKNTPPVPLNLNDNQRLSERPAVVSSDEPAPGVPTDDSLASIKRTRSVDVEGIAPSSSETEYGSAPSQETVPEFTKCKAPVEGVLIDLADGVTALPPKGFESGTDSTTHPEKEDVPAAEPTPIDGPADWEDEDEVVLQGNKAMAISIDLNTGSHRCPRSSPLCFDLPGAFKPYSEVVIYK